MHLGERGSTMSWLDELKEGDKVRVCARGVDIDEGIVKRQDDEQIVVEVPSAGHEDRYHAKSAFRAGSLAENWERIEPYERDAAMGEEPFTPYKFEQLSIEEAARVHPRLWATIESTLHLTQSNIALMVSIVVGTCGSCHDSEHGCQCWNDE